MSATDPRLDQPTEVVNPVLAEIRRTLAEMHDHLIAHPRVLEADERWADEGGYTPEKDYEDLKQRVIDLFCLRRRLYDLPEKLKDWPSDELEIILSAAQGQLRIANGTAEAYDAEQEKLYEAEDQHERVWTYDELCDEWVYVAGIKRFVLRAKPEAMMWDRIQFDSKFGYVVRSDYYSGKKLSALMFDRHTKTIRKPSEMVYLPGQGEFLDNMEKWNLYRPGTIIPAKGDTTLWNKHFEYLFPDLTYRKIVLDWFAWLLQNLGEKPMHALIVQGRIPGTGKTYIGEVMKKLLGVQNVGEPDEDGLRGKFNEWALHAKLIIIEELRAMNSHDIKRRLHDMITKTRIRINQKNVNAFFIDNCFGFYAMTNDPAALKFDNKDRRYAVVSTPATPRPAAYYDKLYASLKDEAALAAIYYELLHRDLQGYSAQERAPETAAKSEMMRASAGAIELWMLSHADQPPLCYSVVSIDEIKKAGAKENWRGNVDRAIGTCLTDHFHGVQFATSTHRLPGGDRLPRLWAINDYGKAHVDGVHKADGPAERVKRYLAERTN
jgi:hypothetical protein